jgi:hypothetical protein
LIASFAQRGFGSAAFNLSPGPGGLIDGEAIVSDEAGLAVFELIRARPTTSPPCSARSMISAQNEHFVSAYLTPLLSSVCGRLQHSLVIVSVMDILSGQDDDVGSCEVSSPSWT